MASDNQYKRSEVAEHSDVDSAWIIIKNKVYDVSKFIPEHPGGEEVVLEFAGKDATEAFNDVGHSTDAQALLTQHYIGDIVESEEDQAKAKPAPQQSATASSGMSWVLPVAIVVLGVALAYRFFSQQS
ncbi:Cytochrome b5 [Trichoplax sp. H2]|uniref:Cytochrome b5 n=1 Tax=Trichoplax adhaerens TaxID=10228 RepID=B3RJI2_TRIAD|nr:expressed hypothetical protein [Trichoplax adhaerens]EDV29823.1 expressed hypothetical protein [Trichoplax adhaerens]RDD40301.1 Cytochrome b5 [Trichoplax sp. H2]|eukprot:XP_002109025.1 expressed hypothetical protein [Trichoplax adhaerens]